MILNDKTNKLALPPSSVNRLFGISSMSSNFKTYGILQGHRDRLEWYLGSFRKEVLIKELYFHRGPYSQYYLICLVIHLSAFRFSSISFKEYAVPFQPCKEQYLSIDFLPHTSILLQTSE